MGHELDLAEHKSWIGRTRVATDTVTPRLLRSFEAVLSPHLAVGETGVPPGFHWCLAPDIVEHAKLGDDGHPVKGEFLPLIPLPRRMWAGGSLVLHSQIREGDSIEKRSTIAAIEEKQGRPARYASSRCATRSAPRAGPRSKRSNRSSTARQRASDQQVDRTKGRGPRNPRQSLTTFAKYRSIPSSSFATRR